MMVTQKTMKFVPLSIPVDERTEEIKARILAACTERDGRRNLRALNVFLAAVEEAGNGIIPTMLESGLQGFEWWLLYQEGCSRNAKLFCAIIQEGMGRETLAMIPAGMDTEPDRR